MNRFSLLATTKGEICSHGGVWSCKGEKNPSCSCTSILLLQITKNISEVVKKCVPKTTCWLEWSGVELSEMMNYDYVMTVAHQPKTIISHLQMQADKLLEKKNKKM
jgi:hypothetical protein